MKSETGDASENLDPEAAKVIAREKYRILLPGDTSKVVLESANWYKTHQLSATKTVEGNVILAGDAAHVSSMRFD